MLSTSGIIMDKVSIKVKHSLRAFIHFLPFLGLSGFEERNVRNEVD